LFSFIKKRFLHRFILVYISDLKVNVHTYDVKNLKVINQISEDFTLEDSEQFTDELISYINEQQEPVSRSYVVSLLNSQGQGIVPTCSTSEFKKYNIDRRYTYNICVDTLFSNYVTKIDIKWIQKIFSTTGIDLIFSPFILLKDLILSHDKTSETILYILYMNHSASMIIKNEKKFIYGSFFQTNSSENPLYCDYSSDKEDDDDEFEIDEEIDFEDDIELDENDDYESEYIKEVSIVEENKTFAKFLSNSLKEFYSNDIYEGTFVDKVIIYSEDTIDKSIIEYIENELFLNTEFISVELDPIVLKFCEKEVIGV
jgi:hypothetical protein